MKAKNTRAQQTKNITNNIIFFLKNRGETKTSFSQKTGITRATVYNILGGKVKKIHQSTLYRISNFLGVSCETIKNFDISEIKNLDETLSLKGNQNPIAIPVIPQTSVIKTMSRPIGELVHQFSTTYYFGTGGNHIALYIDVDNSTLFSIGSLLVMNRSPLPSKYKCSLFINSENKLIIRDSSLFAELNDWTYIGQLIEVNMSTNGLRKNHELSFQNCQQYYNNKELN